MIRSKLSVTCFLAWTLFFTMSALFTPQLHADYYQYTDSEGTVVMVDDEGKIPPAFRNQTKITRGDPDGGKKVTSVRVRNNMVLVPVRFSYRNSTAEAVMLLDTGASLTMLSTTLAGKLGIKSDSTERRYSQVADGRVVQTQVTRVDSMTVGPKVKYSAEISIMNMAGPGSGFDGLLGMNFLGDFPYRVDLNGQYIEWQ